MRVNSRGGRSCDLRHNWGVVVMAERRRDSGAVNKIFGSELPTESTDEADREAGRSVDDRDDWLRDNVPPHHN